MHIDVLFLVIMFQAWYFYYTLYISLSLGFLLLFYFTGKSLFYLARHYIIINGHWERLFIYTLFSVLLGVSIYALVLSNGNSIHIFILLLLLWMMFYVRKQFSKNGPIVIGFNNANQSRGIILEVVLVLLVLFSVKAMFVLKSGAFPFHIPYNDYVFYNDMLKSMSLNGLENTHAEYNFFYEHQRGLFPYHYFDLWMSSLISLRGYFSTYLSHHLSASTLLLFLIYAGLRILIMDMTSHKLSTALFSISFFVFGVSVNYWINIDSYPYLSELNGVSFLLTMEKYIPIPLFLIFSIFLYNQKQKFLSILILVVMACIYQTIFPFIITSIILYFIWCYWKYKEQKDLSIILYLFVFSISLSLFYFFNKGDYFTITSPLLNYTDFKSYTSIKIVIIEYLYRCLMDLYHITITNYINIILFCLIFLYNRKNNNPYLPLHFSILGMSLFLAFLARNFFYKMIDSEQFLGNLGPCLYLLLFLYFVRFLTQSNMNVMLRMIFNILFGLLMLFNALRIYRQNYKTLSHAMSYDASFCNKLKHVFPDDKDLIGVYFGSHQNYMYAPHNTIYVRHHSSFLMFYPQFFSVIDINILNIKNWDTGRHKGYDHAFIKRNPFYQYVEKNKHSPGTIGSQQVMFIKKYHLKYGIQPVGGILEPEVEALVVERIQDPKSKITFLRF